KAEDGIRDRNVTGVQTCALPISFFIAACSQSKKEAATEEHLDDLNVHKLAKHEDKELDEYYSELYENLKHTIKENPNMGKEDKLDRKSDVQGKSENNSTDKDITQ